MTDQRAATPPPDAPTPGAGHHAGHHAGGHTDHPALTTVPNSPEALDDLVATTSTRGWIALAAVAVMLVAVVVWSFTARLPLQTQATAVVYEPGHTYQVVAGDAGSVRVTVRSGQNVRQGEEVAVLTPFSSTGSSAPATRSIVAPIGGQVRDVLVPTGTGVNPTDNVVTITPADTNPSQRHAVMFLSAAHADLYTNGRTVMVRVDDPSSGTSGVFPAMVTFVANVPSEIRAMRTSLQSEPLADEMMSKADGAPYRVELTISDLGSLPALQRPAQGQILTVTNTYADPHPVELLFGATK